MDNTTLTILIVILLLCVVGGWYGRGGRYSVRVLDRVSSLIAGIYCSWHRLKPDGFSPFQVRPWSTSLQQVITGHACGERVAIIARAISRPRMSANYMK